MEATRLEQSYEDSLLELDSIRNALLQRAAQKQQALKAAKENGRQEPEKDDANNAVSTGACIQRQDTDRSLMEQHEEADEEQRRLSVELAGLNGVDYVEPQSDEEEEGVDVDLPPPPPPLPPPPLTNPAAHVHPSTPKRTATHTPPSEFAATLTAASASGTPQRSPDVCSAASASPNRHKDFADKLMRREGERRRRIDVLRQQREAQELSSLRSTPSINPISHQLAASASASLLSNAASSPRDDGTDECVSEGGGGARVLGVAERSELYVAITRAKTEKIRQELQQKEVEGVSAAPVINESSRRLQRSVEDMMHWQQTVQAKKQARSAQCQEAATKELTHQPTLCTRSNQIYEQMKRQGRCGAQSVVDRLMAKGTEAKHKHEQARRKADNDARHQAVPEVAPHSATLPRHGPVEERLYAIAYENRVKQDERVVQAEKGRRTADGYRPKINRRSEALARHRRPVHVPVEEQLVAHGQYYEERRRRRLAAEQDKAKRMAEARKITPRSQEIAEQLGSTAQERLNRPTGVIRSWTLEMIEEPSFKPRINKSRGWDNCDGEDGSSCGPGGRDLLQRMEEWDRRRKERIEREREQRSRREDEECTFQPRVPKSSSRAALSISGSCGSIGGADSTADLSTDYDDMSRASSARRREKSMWERNAEWMMARDEKLEKERQQKRDEELVGCSFAPRLATNRSFSSELPLFQPPPPSTRTSDPPTPTRQLLLNSPLSALVLRSPEDDDERSYYGDEGDAGVAQVQEGDREDGGCGNGGGGAEEEGAEVQYVSSLWRSLCEEPPTEAQSSPVESAAQVRSLSSSSSVATTSSSSRRRPSLVFYSDTNPRPDPTPPPAPHHAGSRRSSISSTDAGAYNVASGQAVLPGGHWPAQVTAAWVAQQYMYEGQGSGVHLPARSESNELSEYIKKFQHLRMS